MAWPCITRKGLLSCAIIGTAIAFIVIGIGLGMFAPPKHYWNGSGIDMPLGAPDGIYEVLPNWFDNVTQTVNFPICSHSYGFLHGTWEYDNSSGLVWFPTSEGWLTPCVLRLSSNVIVEAWKK